MTKPWVNNLFFLFDYSDGIKDTTDRKKAIAQNDDREVIMGFVQ